MRKKTTARKGQVHRIGSTNTAYGLNAFTPLHMPLPRPVAPYTVVRTIQNFTLAGNGNAQFWCFVPFTDDGVGPSVANKLRMTSYCGFMKNNATLSPTANGMDLLNLSSLANGTTGGIECVPAAMTVRLTCPSALQGAAGQFFLGRWSVAADPRSYATFEDMRSGFLSYGHPRPLTAARLAMRGVEVSSVARDMNVCSEFLPLHATDAGNKIVNKGSYSLSDPLAPWSGFTPIVLIAEDSVTAATTINVQVAIEWRWRFSLDNVAASTHTYHKPATAGVWSSIMETASTAGNGVTAIAEAAPTIARVARAAVDTAAVLGYA